MKVIAFIDGFNLYHSLIKDKEASKCKWLDLQSLCKSFLTKEESLIDVYYFTAFVTWDQGKSNRHKLFIKALETTGVKVIYGKFKPISKKCRKCKQFYWTHEEKQTDVNIALTILEKAFQENFDKFLILSADSDLIPAINKVRKYFPDKKTHLILPYNSMSEMMKNITDKYSKVSLSHLKRNLFPDVIKGHAGVGDIRKPEIW